MSDPVCAHVMTNGHKLPPLETDVYKIIPETFHASCRFYVNKISQTKNSDDLNALETHGRFWPHSSRQS